MQLFRIGITLGEVIEKPDGTKVVGSVKPITE